jgi:hypothetical protein
MATIADLVVNVKANTSGLQKVGSAMTKFVTLPVVAGMGLAVKAASDLGEQMNVVKVQFEDAAPKVLQFAKAAESIGIAKAEALEAAAGFGGMLDAAGFVNKEAAEMSIRMVKLAGDMASFRNQDPSEMLDRLRGGLAGEAEPLRRFGVFLSENEVKLKAVELGIAAYGAELTEAQKIQARYAIVLEQTEKAHGDFARTVGTSLPNQMRVLKAQVTNTAAEFGKVLLPIAQRLVGWLKQLADWFKNLTPAQKEMAVQIAAVAAAAGPLLIVISKLAGAFKLLIGGVAGLVSPLGLVAVALAGVGFAAFDAWRNEQKFKQGVEDLTGAMAKGQIDAQDMANELKDLAAQYDDVALKQAIMARGTRALQAVQRNLEGQVRTGEAALRNMGVELTDTEAALLASYISAKDFHGALSLIDRLIAGMTAKMKAYASATNTAAASLEQAALKQQAFNRSAAGAPSGGGGGGGGPSGGGTPTGNTTSGGQAFPSVTPRLAPAAMVTVAGDVIVETNDADEFADSMANVGRSALNRRGL